MYFQNGPVLAPLPPWVHKMGQFGSLRWGHLVVYALINFPGGATAIATATATARCLYLNHNWVNWGNWVSRPIPIGRSWLAQEASTRIFLPWSI